MDQYHRPEPYVTINDLIDMKQGDRETVLDEMQDLKSSK